ncbi:flagellar basal body-associated FliL family protein [Bartonella ancashensis]|uniref:Flagellar protein FliL n=1 Tax=Bartonella ancashensis TaxID=1318743 RepID=A0A0M4M2A0_9HYPH|nr:flagellar basal body-associated FliL family protein [Bartonella ancashensis]ALE02962.1 Flagellar biosynthesis protein FliL [Bartonella ancashensis]
MEEAPMQEKTTTKENHSVVTLLIVGVILTLIAGASGWFFGIWIDQKRILTSDNSKEASVQKSVDRVIGSSHVIALPPIVTNIAEPETAWIRAEIFLVVQSGQTISSILVSDISNDFLAFLHQVTIDQIEGPSGLMNLRADLFDRAKIRSDNKISNILISQLVIEQ